MNDCRARGNDFFRAENYISAIVEYDRALSVWDWVESVLSDWKRQVKPPPPLPSLCTPFLPSKPPVSRFFVLFFIGDRGQGSASAVL